MEGFQGKSSSGKKLRVHFSHQHSRDSIVTLEEGNEPHPRLPQCNMFVPQEALNRTHPTSAMCWRGSERKRQRMVVADTD